MKSYASFHITVRPLPANKLNYYYYFLRYEYLRTMRATLEVKRSARRDEFYFNSRLAPQTQQNQKSKHEKPT